MKNFSILIPTRNRVSSLQRTLQTIYNTVKNKDQVEILLVVDDDDLDTMGILPELKETYKIFDLSYYIIKRNEFVNEYHYNYLARLSKGKFIWCCADDIIFLVNNWDIIILNKINKYFISNPDRLVCINLLDTTLAPGNLPPNEKKFSCFPMFSKEVLSVLGFILAPQIPTWNGDVYVALLFTKANRVLIINDQYYLDHVGYHTKTLEADANTVRMGEINAKYAVNPKHDIHKQGPIIEQQVNILKAYIEKQRIKYA